ncbi:rhamnose ABC transporter, periplasmic rhamnose-binding protein [Agrobacterium tumefaciens]|nr:rhamnose ABC transporter, periplasmic rhamnose-binding protein [Agrobacterium tumefaciens]
MPDRKGKAITIVDVPKLIGIGYFNATSKGISEAATEIGNMTATTDGPTQANIDDQITVIDNYITKGVDGILFVANDPVAIAPVLKKALAAGINVVGYDANSQPDARQWFVNQAEFDGIAKAMIDNLAKEVGEDASFAIVTSTFTTPGQGRWIAEMAAYAASCHPGPKVA